MAILSDGSILSAIGNGDIKIEPFDRAALGTNSYDVHLGHEILTYLNRRNGLIIPLDCMVRPHTLSQKIPGQGFRLEPGELYLASTIEYTESHRHVPFLEGKCFQKGTLVRMADGSCTPVEDVRIGDRILSSDGVSLVDETHSGTAELFEIWQSRGQAYVVNGSHILVLRCGKGTKNRSYPVGKVIEITVRDYMALPLSVRKHLYGFRAEAPLTCAGERPLDPYMLGVWLGDGTCGQATLSINNNDVELLSLIREKFPLAVFHQYKPGCLTINLTTEPRSSFKRTNTFLDGLRGLGIDNNKRIPRSYLSAPSEDRLAVLAGLLDTDGYVNHCCWEIITVFDGLKNDIVELAQSLGFTVSQADKIVKGELYHRLNISGDVLRIPTILNRKRKDLRSSKTVGRSDSLISVRAIGIGQYFGFSLASTTIAGQRFFIEDYTVVHNSSLGRLGMSIHVTAGKGDVGFCNHWTMEITVVYPLIVYAGMPVGQLIWHEVTQPPEVAYGDKASAKYQGRDSRPRPSEMYKNFGKTKP